MIMNKLHIPLIIILLLPFTGCEKKNAHRYTPEENCRNLSLEVTDLYPGDRVFLYYDTRLLLRQKVDSVGVQHFQREFCNRYRQQGELRIVIMEDKKVLIDTALRIEMPATGYHISANRFLRSLSIVPLAD